MSRRCASGTSSWWIVTREEIPDPHALSLRTWVNGELRMDGRSDEFLHDCWDMIAELSSVFTLEPGDILATGSPAGVGALMNPPRFLTEGDVVRVEVERIGANIGADFWYGHSGGNEFGLFGRIDAVKIGVEHWW